jgi:hypothetical protein
MQAALNVTHRISKETALASIVTGETPGAGE